MCRPGWVLGAADRQPALAGQLTWPTWSASPTASSVSDLLADEPPWTPRLAVPAAARDAALTRAADQQDPAGADQHGGDDLQCDGVGRHDRDDRGGEAAHGDEQHRTEREVVQLHGDQHDADCDPCNGQSGPFVVSTILRSDKGSAVQSGSGPIPRSRGGGAGCR